MDKWSRLGLIVTAYFGQNKQTRGSVGWACVTHLSFCFEET